MPIWPRCKILYHRFHVCFIRHSNVFGNAFAGTQKQNITFNFIWKINLNRWNMKKWYLINYHKHQWAHHRMYMNLCSIYRWSDCSFRLYYNDLLLTDDESLFLLDNRIYFINFNYSLVKIRTKWVLLFIYFPVSLFKIIRLHLRFCMPKFVFYFHFN